jgi:outer membrane protein assembly factor BamA
MKLVLVIISLALCVAENSSAKLLCYLCTNTQVESIRSSQPDTTKPNDIRLMLLPIVFRSPDTGFAGGILPQLIFQKNEEYSPSTLRLDAYYTQNSQYHILLRSNNWIKQDKYNLTAKVSLKHWPTSFYGIGNEIQNDNNESFTETLYEADFDLGKRIDNGLYLGVGSLFRYGKIGSLETEGQLVNSNIPGTGNTLVTGIKSSITFDTRDSHFYPTKGSLHKVYLSGSFNTIGSDYEFIKYGIDARKYISITNNQILAIRAQGTFTIGELPFRILPSIGSSLRGYSSAKYIDKNMFSLQFEYRIVPVFWRLGIVIFAGTGDVFDSIDDIQFEKLKHMAGIGLRYVVFRDENINIRFDFSIGRQSTGDYIDLSEAY